MGRLLLSIAFLLWGGIAYSASVYLDGYIVKNDGVTEKCFIKVPYDFNGDIQFRKLMNYVIVRDNKETVVKYKAKHLKGFYFTHKGKRCEFVSFENTMQINVPFKSHVFLSLEERGAINLYRFYYKDKIASPIATFIAKGSVYFVSKGLNDIKRLDEKSDLLEAISDDQELVRSLEKSTIHLKDISKIINQYNNKQNAMVTSLYIMYDE